MTPHSPVPFLVVVKEFTDLPPLEVDLVVVVAVDGLSLVNVVVLLGEELLEGQHRRTLAAGRTGGVGQATGEGRGGGGQSRLMVHCSLLGTIHQT